MNVVASAPEGLEKYLAEEISNLGGFNINSHKRFINFECDLETFYRVHFYSRLAFRCLLYTSPSPRDTDKSRMPSSA